MLGTLSGTSLSSNVRLACSAMAQSPTPPYFSYNREHHRIEMSETLETKLEVPLQNIIRGADAAWITYDASGFAWSFCYTRHAGEFSILRRLLVQLFASLLFLQETAITWTERRPYPLSELRDAYLRGIEADDDHWFTRFVDKAD